MRQKGQNDGVRKTLEAVKYRVKDRGMKNSSRRDETCHNVSSIKSRHKLMFWCLNIITPFSQEALYYDVCVCVCVCGLINGTGLAIDKLLIFCQENVNYIVLKLFYLANTIFVWL